MISEVEYLSSKADYWKEEYEKLERKSEARFDILFDQQKAIVDQRLGLGVKPQAQPMQPVQRRGDWKSTRAKYENDKKKEAWDIHIAEMEKQVALNDTKVVASSRENELKSEEEQDKEDIA